MKRCYDESHIRAHLFRCGFGKIRWRGYEKRLQRQMFYSKIFKKINRTSGIYAKKKMGKNCVSTIFFLLQNKNVLLVLYLYHPLFPFWIVGPFQCVFFSLIPYLLLALSFYLCSFFCFLHLLATSYFNFEVEIQNLKWNKSGIAENTFRCAFSSFLFLLSSNKKSHQENYLFSKTSLQPE